MDPSKLASLIDETAAQLTQFDSIAPFKEFLEEDKLAVQELISTNFADISSRKELINSKLHFAKVHFLELRASRFDFKQSPRVIRALYMSTVHGPWIAYELISEANADTIYRSTKAFPTLNEDLGDGYFKNKSSGNLTKFTYFPDLDNFFAIIATNREDIEDPSYTWNKVIEYFN